MSVLRNLESKLAGLVEGTFSRAFKSEVRPVEIARKLTREMEEHKVQSLSRIYAPNEYAIWLSPDDRKQFEGYEDDLATELSGYLLEHARRERIALVTAPKITLPHRRPPAPRRVRHPGPARRARPRTSRDAAEPGRRGPHDGLHGLRAPRRAAARARPPARQRPPALRGPHDRARPARRRDRPLARLRRRARATRTSPAATPRSAPAAARGSSATSAPPTASRSTAAGSKAPSRSSAATRSSSAPRA